MKLWNSSRTKGKRRLAVALPTLSVLILIAVAGCQLVGGPTFRVVAPDTANLASVQDSTAAETAKEAQPQNQIAPQPENQVAAKDQSQAYTAKLQISPAKAEVGEIVQVSGSAYPANADVELVWYTVKGRYELEGGTEFVGQRFDPQSQVLKTVRSDASGNISTSLEIPLDFGGAHDIRGRVAGEEMSQASLTIQPTFSMTPREGPIGTPIELKIVGVDWRTNINTWHVLYDNKYTGFMSAVTTPGVAVARLRAAGPIGDHPISLWHNSFNPIPYLNWPQGPYKDVPGAEFTFKVTSDPGVAPPLVEDFTATDNPWQSNTTGPAKLSLSVDRGAVGSPTTLRASDLPANANLELRWWTMVGNRVSAIGFSEDVRVLGEVTTNADGTLVKELKIPDDLGGQHRIDLVDGDKVLGSVGLVIEPSVVSLSPAKVRAGEQVTLHLKGVGWTTYDNTYAVTYDNSYVGYVCGFSTNGDVVFNLTATGAPGTHIIDLYPTIYKGKDDKPRVYSLPQLTYATDHPQRITPAIRLAIEIVE